MQSVVNKSISINQVYVVAKVKNMLILTSPNYFNNKSC